MRTKIFVDFWNFQLSWNEVTKGAQCDWRKLPNALISEAAKRLGAAGLETVSLEETRVYAGYEAGRENQLK